MKKILCYIDELGSGGAERQITNLAILLKAKGYEVDVYCYHPNYFYEYALKEHNIPLIKIELKVNNYWNKISNTRKVFNAKNYDVVIAYSDGPVMIASILKLFNPKLRVIVSERNTTQVLSIKERLKFLLYNFANYIVANSYTQTNFIKSHFRTLKHKTYTITNYIDSNKFTPADNGVSYAGLKIIVVARHSHQKNVPTFIEAVKIAKNMGVKFHVSWYGDNGGGNSEIHEKLVKEYHLEDVLTFYPSQSDIENYYKKANVFCLPSLYEGFPNVVCEAMCSGLPVICSNVCDNPFLIEDGIGGFLFNPKDPTDIALKIKKISLISEEERLNMGALNRTKGVELFSASVFIDKYINLIEGIEV